MDKMNDCDGSLITQAVLFWTGWKKHSTPFRDDSFFLKNFQSTKTLELLAILKNLENDFYLSDARHSARNLKEMGTISSEQFRQKHPDISNEIVDAFAWCYTFDYK